MGVGRMGSVLRWEGGFFCNSGMCREKGCVFVACFLISIKVDLSHYRLNSKTPILLHSFRSYFSLSTLIKSKFSISF